MVIITELKTYGIQSISSEEYQVYGGFRDKQGNPVTMEWLWKKVGQMENSFFLKIYASIALFSYWILLGIGGLIFLLALVFMPRRTNLLTRTNTE